MHHEIEPADERRPIRRWRRCEPLFAKLHEHKLVDNDLRLRATVIDLKHSQTALERQALELADLAQKYSEEKNSAVLIDELAFSVNYFFC